MTLPTNLIFVGPSVNCSNLPCLEELVYHCTQNPFPNFRNACLMHGSVQNWRLNESYRHVFLHIPVLELEAAEYVLTMPVLFIFQSRNWKLTESMEEVPGLKQRCAEASERAESLEGSVAQLEETLAQEREENQHRVAEMEAQYREEKQVPVSSDFM